jgi:hypothetical protein
MASELMVFWGIHQFERSRSDLFQVPTLMLVICVGVNVLINVVECGLLIGSHFFDSLKCTELLYALSELIGQLDLYYILSSINAVALVWLGYAMSHRGVVWFLPALLATTQVVTAFILSFAEHGEALKEFNKILYYATWPIFYSALAWYYSKVAYKTSREE